VRSTPLLPCGMPKDAKRGVGMCVGRAVGWFVCLIIFSTFRTMDFLLSILSNLFTTALWEVGKAFLKKSFRD